MSFITKLDLNFDTSILLKDLDKLLSVNDWPKENIEEKMPGNQISITHRPDEDIWTDGTGNLWDPVKKQFICTEADFTEFNPYLGDYTKNAIQTLAQAENITIGRVRYMKLEPKKGLSVHTDFTKRYHLVLKTDPNAFFGEITTGQVSAYCHHLPADGYVYKVDTTKEHFVYNGSWEDRIHIVINSAY